MSLNLRLKHAIGALALLCVATTANAALTDEEHALLGITGTPLTPVGPPVGAESVGEAGAGVAPSPEATHYKRVRLVIEGVPAGRIADVNRGILMPISRAVGDFTFTIAIDVSDEEGISRATIENTIKETVRQIGGRIVEERLE